MPSNFSSFISLPPLPFTYLAWFRAADLAVDPSSITVTKDVAALGECELPRAPLPLHQDQPAPKVMIHRVDYRMEEALMLCVLFASMGP